jgi:hypothetical protein
VARVTLEPGREKSLVWDATGHREGEGWSWSPGDSFSSSPEKQSHSANPNSVAPPGGCGLGSGGAQILK